MLAFRNGFEYRNSYLHALSRKILLHSVAVQFGEDRSTNQEITPGVSVTFGTRQQNRYMLQNISANTGLNLTNFSHW